MRRASQDQTTGQLPNLRKRWGTEEEKIRAQLQRLNTEKLRIKQNKHEEFQKRLSVQVDAAAARKIAAAERHRRLTEPDATLQSRSAHSKSPVDSKLFAYEFSQPRSRRQLQNTDLSAETVRVDTGTPEHLSKPGPPGSVQPLPDIQAVSIHVSEKEEGLASEDKSSTSKHGEQMEKKVNFDENKLLGTDMKHKKGRSKSIGETTRGPGPETQTEVTKTDSETQKLKDLYNIAIERVKGIDESLMSDKPIPGASIKTFSGSSFAKGFDSDTLKELEGILNDARIFSSRRSIVEDHTRPDLSTNRAQRKRIEHLEKIIKQLKPEEKHFELDPYSTLQCSYLRLSKYNIESLESMCREQGKDPGIHVHKDVTDYNIWEGLKEERRDNLEAKAIQDKKLNSLGALRDALSSQRETPGGQRETQGGRRDSLGGRRDSLGGRRDSLGSRRDSLGSRRNSLGDRHASFGALVLPPKGRESKESEMNNQQTPVYQRQRRASLDVPKL